MKFKVSIIIPAFNVERFIEKAIRSALNQEEVGEVIVVNDGSTDKTVEIIKKLITVNPKIKLYHHENKINKGRSATRNLGIKKATQDYIAFLDADDFYLENRFKNDKVVFAKHTDADGVYNAVGFHFYREVTTLESEKLKLNTLSKKVKPEAFFDAMISSKYGYLHLNGITITASVFENIGLFNETLVVAEDSDIIIKMGLMCRLESGNIKQALALRGVHETNVFNNDGIYKKYRNKLYESLISWSIKKKISIDKIDVIFKWLWIIRYREDYSLFENIIYWNRLFIKNPKCLFSYLSIKYFPIISLRQKIFPFLYKY